MGPEDKCSRVGDPDAGEALPRLTGASRRSLGEGVLAPSPGAVFLDPMMLAMEKASCALLAGLVADDGLPGCGAA